MDSDLDMSKVEENLAKLEEVRLIGNKLFGESKFAEAAAKYEKVLRYDFSFRTCSLHWFADIYELIPFVRYLKEFEGDATEDQEKLIEKAKVPCYSNAAACYLKLKKNVECVENCKKVRRIIHLNLSFHLSPRSYLISVLAYERQCHSGAKKPFLISSLPIFMSQGSTWK